MSAFTETSEMAQGEERDKRRKRIAVVILFAVLGALLAVWLLPRFVAPAEAITQVGVGSIVHEETETAKPAKKPVTKVNKKVKEKASSSSKTWTEPKKNYEPKSDFSPKPNYKPKPKPSSSGEYTEQEES